MSDRGPYSLRYQRVAASCRPYRDITRTLPSPTSRTASSASGSSSVAYAGASLGSSGGVGKMSPTPRSPGRTLRSHGTHRGATIASGPGVSTTSLIVTGACSSAVATVTDQRHPR